MAATRKTEYAASAAVTISLASLASSATFVAGRESTLVDNTSNKYLDYQLSGKITTGTTPTVNTEIRVYVVGIMEDSTWPDVFDGTDSPETVTSTYILDGLCALAARLQVSASSDIAYPLRNISVRALFGGVLPKKFVVFVSHNTVVALNATGGNHTIYVTGEYESLNPA